MEREILTHTWAIKYIEGIDAVICCIFGQELNEKELRTSHETNAGLFFQWEESTTTKYWEVIHFAGQAKAFLDEGIEEFHTLCGDFMVEWVA